MIRIGENRKRISYFRTKKPSYCKKTKEFSLNFHGRLTRPSIKNFILETECGKEVLVFGKNGENLFSMEVFYPLTPFISFALVIPFFAGKL